jgi:hypothetical protein
MTVIRSANKATAFAETQFEGTSSKDSDELQSNSHLSFKLFSYLP